MRCGKCKVYSEADWTVQSKKIFFWWRRESKKPSRRRKFFILDSRHLGFSWLKLSCLALVFCLPLVYMAAILECVWTLGWWLLKDAEVLSLASSCPTNYAKTSTNPEIAFQCFQASLLHVYKVKKSRKRNAIFFLFCLDLLGLMKSSFVESWCCNLTYFWARTRFKVRDTSII